MTERSHVRLVFWLTVLLVVYTAIAWTISDYTVCVGSQTVTVGQAPIVNPVTCS